MLRLLLCLLAVSSVYTVEYPAGVTRSIPCVGTPGETMDLFIPKSYLTNTDQLFPILFISGPGGTPRTMNMNSWAERNNVILASINNSKNGPSEPIIASQEAVIKTVNEQLRIHPVLRFAMGFSGAGQASWLMTNRHKDEMAGLLMIGQSGFDLQFPNHIPVAFLYGKQEPNKSGIESKMKKLLAAKNPLHHKIIEGGHIPGTPADRAELLDWILAQARIHHPGLSDNEKSTYRQSVLTDITAFIADKNWTDACQKANAFLCVPLAAKSPEGKEIAAALIHASFESAKAQTNLASSYLQLCQLSSSPYISSNKRIKKEVKSLMKDMKKKKKELKKVEKDFKAYQSLKKTADANTNSPAKMKKVQTYAEGFIDKSPNSPLVPLMKELIAQCS